MDERHKNKLFKDVFWLSLSLFVAVFLAWSGIIEDAVHWAGKWGIVGIFLAGMGFSSAFTTAPSIVILFNLAQEYDNILPFVVVAALGAMCGDWFIFKFLRDGLDEDIQYLVEHASSLKRLKVIFRSRLFYWFGAFFAALIIASPLPDEFGLALFGLIHLDKRKFMPVSFIMNFLGIFGIALAAKFL